eukprot:4077561-Amphidinium_carterae.1
MLTFSFSQTLTRRSDWPRPKKEIVHFVVAEAPKRFEGVSVHRIWISIVMLPPEESDGTGDEHKTSVLSGQERIGYDDFNIGCF